MYIAKEFKTYKMKKLVVLSVILIGLFFTSCQPEQCEYELIIRNQYGEVVGYEYYWDDCY